MQAYRLLRNVVAFTILTSYSTGIASQGAVGVYVIKDGEILSRIARRHFGAPIYSPSGALAKILKLNPEIQNPDLIVPGQIINISSNGVGLESNRSLASEVFEKMDVKVATDPASPKSEPGENNFPFSSYTLSPTLYYSTLSGKDLTTSTSADLISKMNFALSGAWSQNWSKDFATQILAGFKREDYYSTDTATLENTTLTQGYFGLGSKFNLSEKFQFHSSFKFSQETLHRAKTVNTLVIESVALPKFSLGLDYRLLKIKQYVLNFNAEGIMILPSKAGAYDLKLGKGYKTGLRFSEAFDEHKKIFSCEVFYSFLSQNSSQMEQSKKETGLGCSMEWRLGGDQTK